MTSPPKRLAGRVCSWGGGPHAYKSHRKIKVLPAIILFLAPAKCSNDVATGP